MDLTLWIDWILYSRFSIPRIFFFFQWDLGCFFFFSFFTKIQIGILIRKQIFRFFTKIQKRIIDPKLSTTEVESLGTIQNQILWTQNLKSFFITDSKNGTFSDTSFLLLTTSPNDADF